MSENVKNNEIAERIKKARIEKNLSQERFGKKVGISAKTISAYETGRIIPSYKVLEKISDAYDISVFISHQDIREKMTKKLAELEKSLQEVKKILD